ncbi:MAG: CASTOR/POLLUX-related putative ion channel [Acidimicrobiales bacterium]
MGRPDWRARLRYRFHNTLSRGTTGLITWLALVTGALILLVGLFLTISHMQEGDSSVGVIEAVWLSLLAAFDTGLIGEDNGWVFRVASIIVAIGGIFVVSALIGLITAALEEKIGELRKGRSPVLESGHSLILGWSPKLFAILSELIISNENEKDPCIVVAANRDKVEMEDALRTRLGDTGRTRIVCRTCEPSDLADLALVQAPTARAIIILCSEDPAGDADVVRTILALMSLEGGIGGTRVVAELTDRRHAVALEDATSKQVVTVVSSDVIARIAAQVCRQSGLSVIFQELLNFSGDEIYFRCEPSLAGRTFAEAILSYEDSAVMGVRFSDGRVVLSPPMGTVLGPDDQIIALSRDDDTLIVRSGGPIPVTGDGDLPPLEPRGPETILMVGWNSLAPRILSELDRHVPTGSNVKLLVDPEFSNARRHDPIPGLEHLAVEMVEADTTRPEPLSAAFSSTHFDHAIILSYREGLTPAEADARTLLSLLQLSQVLRAHPEMREKLTVVSELLDARDVELARAADADDFIVSERLTSLMIAQLAENLELDAVFDDLFNHQGAEIRLRPVRSYVTPGTPSTFGAAVGAAQARGEVAIGYRHLNGNGRGAGSSSGVALNPPKSDPITFGEDDQLIVLSAN